MPSLSAHSYSVRVPTLLGGVGYPGAGYSSWKASFDEEVNEALKPVTSEAHEDASRRILAELQA